MLVLDCETTGLDPARCDECKRELTLTAEAPGSLYGTVHGSHWLVLTLPLSATSGALTLCSYACLAKHARRQADRLDRIAKKQATKAKEAPLV